MTARGRVKFVDREEEIGRFCELLKSERSRSVLLIRGGERMGKTCLLERLEAECQSRFELLPDGDHGEVCIAKVNFREESNDVLDGLSLIRLLRNRLQPSYVGRLNHVINLYTQRGPASGARPRNGLAELKDPSQPHLVRLAEMIDGSFTLSTFPVFTSENLEIRYASLRGDTPKEKAFDLAELYYKSGKLDELKEALKETPSRFKEDEWEHAFAPLLSDGSGHDHPEVPDTAVDGRAPLPEDADRALDRGAPLPVDGGQDGALCQISEAFIKYLNDLSDVGKLVVLFFDGCEKRPPYAEPWIRNELFDRLGKDKLGNVVIILAGRTLVDWSDLDVEHLVDERKLDSFDEERVRQFFEAHGIEVEPDVIKSATILSGGVPGELIRMVDRVRAKEDREDSFYD